MNATVAVLVFSMLAIYINSCSGLGTCKIEGLPENRSKIGNVFLVNSDNDTIELSLTCRCTLFQPLWQVYEVESKLSDPFTGDLRCTNTTNANQACNTETSHLAQETPNVSVINSYDFIITETTAIMCFSDEIRQIVIVTVQDIIDNGSMEQLPSQPTSTSTIPKSSIQPSISIRTIMTTSVSSLQPMSSSVVNFHSARTTVTTSNTSTVITSASTTNSNIMTARTSEESMTSVTQSVTPTVANTEIISSDTLKFLDDAGTLTLIAVPVAAIMFLLNVILIFWIIKMKVRRRNDKTEDMLMIPQNESGVRRPSTSNHSLERLIPHTVIPLQNIYNLNSNNNSNVIRTSQSATVLSNPSVLEI